MTRWVLSDDPSVWLAWVQGLTTVLLTLFTGVYVWLTKRTADASAAQAAAADAAVRLAERQFDSTLLSSYLPVQAAVSAALGMVKAARILPDTTPGQIVPDNFARALVLSETIGGGLAATLSAIHVLLKSAQQYKDGLITAQEKHRSDSVLVTYYREMFKLSCEGLEQMLSALHAELKPTVERLSQTAGRVDVTMEHLKTAPEREAHGEK